MSLTPATITPGKRISRPHRRVGRGNASQKGTTAGKGTKGQKARSGGRGGLSRMSLRPSLLKVPKLRGFKSNFARLATVSLGTLERMAEEGITITPAWLEQKGLVKTAKHGVKVLATGELKKKIIVQGCIASKTAAAAIEKAGGKMVF